MQTRLPKDASDRRTASRTSPHLAASLYCDGICSSVKIRNISAEGALLESVTSFAPGSLVQLVRGSLIVHGLVSWSEDQSCGLKFSGNVNVQQWQRTPSNSEQQRIDDVMRLVKAGTVPLPIVEASHTPAAEGATLSDDLRRAGKLLSNLEDQLAKDSIVVAVYPSELQNLDIAMQIIAAVGTILKGKSDPATDDTKFVTLRRSADQALRTAA